MGNSNRCALGRYKTLKESKRIYIVSLCKSLKNLDHSPKLTKKQLNHMNEIELELIKLEVLTELGQIVVNNDRKLYDEVSFIFSSYNT